MFYDISLLTNGKLMLNISILPIKNGLRLYRHFYLGSEYLCVLHNIKSAILNMRVNTQGALRILKEAVSVHG